MRVQTHRFHITVGAILLLITMTGCGNPSGTVSQLRYVYAHPVLTGSAKKTVQLPEHFGAGVGIGDARPWVDAKWGKPKRVMDNDSKGNENLEYQGNVTVSLTSNRISSVMEDFPVPIAIDTMLGKVKSLIPSDSVLVTHHLAGATDSEVLYQYQSTALAKLVTEQIWPDNPYQVAGTVYVTMQTTHGKVTSVTIGMESPEII